MKCQTTELEIETLVNRIVNGDMDLQPNFQRGEIWPIQKKKKLIDSILRGWRIPPIHVVRGANCIDEVLDGQQRLAAIRDFYKDEFKVDGKIEPSDDDIGKLDGLRYSELPAEWQRKFRQYSINLVRLTEYKPAEPAELFYRLNQPSALTSAEQRNAYIGVTRDQVKYLANLFISSGATPELIGFANSRLAYDEIISKLCYTVQMSTLKKKITSLDISNYYRHGIAFSDECIEIVKNTLDKFIICLKDINGFKFRFNKATLFSWLIFVRQNLGMDNGALERLILSFEFCRTYIKGKSMSADSHLMEEYRILQQKLPYVDAVLNIFNQRCATGTTDPIGITHRDIIINIFKDALSNEKTQLIEFSVQMYQENENMNYVLEKITEEFSWGDVYK